MQESKNSENKNLNLINYKLLKEEQNNNLYNYYFLEINNNKTKQIGKCVIKNLKNNIIFISYFTIEKEYRGKNLSYEN